MHYGNAHTIKILSMRTFYKEQNYSPFSMDKTPQVMLFSKRNMSLRDVFSASAYHRPISDSFLSVEKYASK